MNLIIFVPNINNYIEETAQFGLILTQEKT